MSTCISSHGEYDSHETDPDTFVCKWCHEFDEAGALDEIARLRRGPVTGMEHATDLDRIRAVLDKCANNTTPGETTHVQTVDAYEAAIDAISRIAYPEEDHT